MPIVRLLRGYLKLKKKEEKHSEKQANGPIRTKIYTPICTMIDVDKSESDRKKAGPEELFVKSFGAYSFSAVALWLFQKYEISDFILESEHELVLIVGFLFMSPVVIGLFIGGSISVIGMLAITFEYFGSYQKEIGLASKLKWHYQIFSFVCTFVFAWMLIVLGEKVLS